MGMAGTAPAATCAGNRLRDRDTCLHSGPLRPAKQRPEFPGTCVNTTRFLLRDCMGMTTLPGTQTIYIIYFLECRRMTTLAYVFLTLEVVSLEQMCR